MSYDTQENDEDGYDLNIKMELCRARHPDTGEFLDVGPSRLVLENALNVRTFTDLSNFAAVTVGDNLESRLSKYRYDGSLKDSVDLGYDSRFFDK
jgi:hypothetical protein